MSGAGSGGGIHRHRDLASAPALSLPGSPAAASAAVRAVYGHLTARFGGPAITSVGGASPRVDVQILLPEGAAALDADCDDCDGGEVEGGESEDGEVDQGAEGGAPVASAERAEAHDDEPILLYTLGLSAAPMTLPAGVNQPARAELLLRVPASWSFADDGAFLERARSWPLDWLRALARAPAALGTWLGVGHTIPNGEPPRPLADGTGLAGFVLVPPTCLEEGDDVVTTADGPVQLLSVLPVFPGELRLVQERGLGALVERLVAAGVDDVLSLDRAPVA